MRIIAGEFKGRIIESPNEKTTRPTTDRVRESIFSSIYSRLPELAAVDVLDAFAGSGALGIEALSRGARSCTFIERDRAARDVLERNLASLSLKAPRVRVIVADSFDAAARLRLMAPSGSFCLIRPMPRCPRVSTSYLVSSSITGSSPKGASSSTSTPCKARRPLPKRSS